MANKHRYSAKQVEHALTDAKGMMFLAARTLGCSQETVRQYCLKYPSVQAAKDAQRGIMIDTAELKLWQSIQNGEAWGITLCLKTIGKDRGYVERQELSGTDGTPLWEPTVGLAALLEVARASTHGATNGAHPVLPPQSEAP
jgi:hypothetical protein